ncbi:MAG: formimidoylglutamase, partial [Bacteroidales bacterium]
MDYSIYLEPFDPAGLVSGEHSAINRLGSEVYFFEKGDPPELIRGFEIVVIGVNEDRRSYANEGCAMAPDQIRKFLYRLSAHKNKLNIIDLGNIRQGNQVQDSYYALKSTLTEIYKSGALAIVLGGSQDLTYPMYLAFEALGRIVNLVSIDSRLDNSGNSDVPDAASYLSHIILRKPNFLFNYANLGYQSYFVGSTAIKLLNELYFDAHRLGTIREDLEEAEPVLRNADMLSVDISAVRQSDAPGNGNPSPNGFYGEELCQLMRYAGLTPKLSAAGFFEVNPMMDPSGQTAHLTAQMIWYFLEGYMNRSDDFPEEGNSNFIKYIVNGTGNGDDMIFFKSKSTDRWWMQLPVSKDKQEKLSRHIMVPCSYKDYQKACDHELPDRWWKAYQKL